MRKRTIPLERLDADAFSAFGWVLGTAFPVDPAAIAFSHPGSDFWHMHDFEPGAGGKTELLWVNYRSSSLHLQALEVHWLTEQAIIPLFTNSASRDDIIPSVRHQTRAGERENGEIEGRRAGRGG